MLRHLTLITLGALIVGCAEKQVLTEVTPAASPTQTAATVEEPAGKAIKATTTTAHTTQGGVNCKIDGDARSIEVVETESGGCETKYTKNGETQSVATAKSGTEYCHGVVEKIKTNLSAAGFTCE